MQFDIESNSHTQQEIKRLIDSLGCELTNLGQLLYLIDKVWDEIGCDNQIIDEDKMTKFYSHPVWILSGLFAEQDPLSGSSGFEGISRTNGNRKPVWAMITA